MRAPIGLLGRRTPWLLLFVLFLEACGGGSRTTGPSGSTVLLPVRGLRVGQLPANCSGVLTATGPGPTQTHPLPPLQVSLSLAAGVWTLTANITCDGQSASGQTTVTVVPPNPVSVVIDLGINGTLTVSTSGSGTVSGPGIACGGDCTETYTIGTVVTLTATPAPGFIFAGWGGACGGTGPCTFTVTPGPISVTATFASGGLTVVKAGTGSGTVTGPGISCGGTCNASYPPGTVVTLTASPAPGSTFAGWSGGGCSGTGSCTVTVSGPVVVTATFNAGGTLTVAKTGTGSGTVSGPGINCGGTCSASYPPGTVVTLTASPAPGSTFAGWTGGGCSGTGSCTVTVSGNVSITATFVASAVLSVTLNFESGGLSGSVTSSPPGLSCSGSSGEGPSSKTCTANFATGTVVTLTASASGFTSFDHWSGSGCSGSGTCTVTMDTSKSVTAHFCSCD
ncbi:MAG TPA: hypothetical protein VGX21_10285 [Methylomirabilota bacterium]|jgi:uncharacterized repeat protein (TIGR02543 family)|nr:hypothetical protein [Methylomirabilota bacterium]